MSQRRAEAGQAGQTVTEGGGRCVCSSSQSTVSALPLAVLQNNHKKDTETTAYTASML